MKELKVICDCCMKSKDIDEVEHMRIPDRSCGITHPVTMGDFDCWICKTCIKEKGKPTERYMGKLTFKNKGLFE